MTTLSAKSVSLYLEGLMILTFDGQKKLLEAAPLSQADHNLLGVIHRRPLNNEVTPGGWGLVNYDPFMRSDIQEFATGRIFIESSGTALNSDAALSESGRSVDNEEWGTFGCIPDLKDEFFGQEVTLKYGMLKPSLRISTGTFYSVLRPRHPDLIHEPPILESFRVNKDQLQCVRNMTTTSTPENDIIQWLVRARKSLGIKVYTAATFLELAPSQNLVCQLKNNGSAEPVEVLRIKHDENYELRMAIRNFPILPEHGSTEADDDPSHTFHSLYFYNAINVNICNQFLLSDEYKQRKYVKKEKIPIDTGADPVSGGAYPCCPIGRRLGTITV